MQVYVDSENVTFRGEEANNKTSMYVYTAHMLATPSHVPVRQMPLDLDNSLPGVFLWIVKTKNDDTISFLSHVKTCAVIDMGKLLLHKYIMKKHPSFVA